jgi:20S proteasome alpha/beta subunit
METFNPYEITTTGTTIMAVKYSKGVILACDTRTARGVIISDRVSLKANMISPDVTKHGHILVLRAGTASHTQVVTKYVRNYLAMHAMELRDRPVGNQLTLLLYLTLKFRLPLDPN